MPARSPDSETTPATPVTGDLGDLDFETALAELESLVDGMEEGEMSLEASLAAFERGVKLTRHCQTALREAELKVKQLTADNTLEAFDADDLDDD